MLKRLIKPKWSLIATLILMAVLSVLPTGTTSAGNGTECDGRTLTGEHKNVEVTGACIIEGTIKGSVKVRAPDGSLTIRAGALIKRNVRTEILCECHIIIEDGTIKGNLNHYGTGDILIDEGEEGTILIEGHVGHENENDCFEECVVDFKSGTIEGHLNCNGGPPPGGTVLSLRISKCNGPPT